MSGVWSKAGDVTDWVIGSGSVDGSGSWNSSSSGVSGLVRVMVSSAEAAGTGACVVILSIFRKILPQHPQRILIMVRPSPNCFRCWAISPSEPKGAECRKQYSLIWRMRRESSSPSLVSCNAHKKRVAHLQYAVGVWLVARN